jgi:probable rRNA maturation factor
MILLDPDLGPDPVPDVLRRLGGGKRSSAPSEPLSAQHEKIPSKRALAGFLREARTAVRLPGEVSVLLTSDAALRRLNRRFRGKNKTTDVLSFPAEGPAAEELAGDLAISVAAACRQGAACGHSLGTELKVLILHGLLHLAGYDHESDYGRMARRERLLRRRLGLPVGLIERAGIPMGSSRDGRGPVARGSGGSMATRKGKDGPKPAVPRNSMRKRHEDRAGSLQRRGTKGKRP